MLKKKIFLEWEKDVMQFERRRELKSSVNIELYMPDVHVPYIGFIFTGKILITNISMIHTYETVLYCTECLHFFKSHWAIKRIPSIYTTGLPSPLQQKQ